MATFLTNRFPQFSAFSSKSFVKDSTDKDFLPSFAVGNVAEEDKFDVRCKRLISSVDTCSGFFLGLLVTDEALDDSAIKR